MKIIILSLVSLLFVLNLIVHYLNHISKNRSIEDNVKDIYDEEKYLKWKSYQNDNLKVDVIDNIVSYLFTMLILIFNVHSYLFNFVYGFVQGVFLEFLVILFVVSVVNLIIDIGFNYYKTFVIEEKYGFNKSTKKLFVKDTIIKLILLVLLETSALFFLNSIYASFNNVYLFLLFALSFLGIIIILIPVLQPLFQKLFNKMVLLEDGELKESITNYTLKVNFPIENIYVMDASKRSSKLNAYFSGFGKRRRIVLFDTLVDKLSVKEIVAVLAHEAGHAKHKDVLKMIPLSLLQFAVIIVVMFYLASSKSVAQAFNFSEANFLFGVLLFFESMGLIGFVLNPISNYFSRKIEYKADRYASETYNKEEMISALKILAGENLVNLSPHPIIVFLKYSHPPIDKRISAITNL